MMSLRNVTETKFEMTSNRHSRIFTPMLPIAAIIWFSVRLEMKMPTEINTAPISTMPAKFPKNPAQPNSVPVPEPLTAAARPSA